MDEAKKIVHVTIRWGRGTGGVKRFIHNAIEALPESEYCQSVASLGPIMGEKQGLKVLGPVVQGDALIGPHGMRDMIRFFEEESPDIVHIHCNNGIGLLCAEAARRAGRAVRVVHSHNSSLGSNELWKRAGDAALKLMYSDAPTARVACSKVAGDWLFGNKSYTVVRNGIELDRFAFSLEQRASVREGLNIPEESRVIGFIGAGIPVKNTSFAIELLVRLRVDGQDAHLVLLGEGEELKMLINLATELGVAPWTHFVGTVSDAWRYYSAMDCLAMPSFYEGLPFSLIEAQANGLPCVVSDSVSREADMTGLLTFLPLSAAVRSWVETIHSATTVGNRKNASDSSVLKLKSAGFSIGDLREQLVDVYTKGARS